MSPTPETPDDDDDPQDVGEPPPALEPGPQVGGFLDDDVPAVVVDADPDEPGPLGAPWPIVLVHGFSGFADLGPLDYFYGVVEHLEEAGVEAFAPAQPPYDGVEVRADVLAAHVDQILEATGRAKVHLICHSQGGLDCRRLVSRLGYEDRVGAIITIATPHRGTPLADVIGQAPDGLVGPAGKLLGWLLGLLEGDPPDESAWDNESDLEEAAWQTDLVAALESMTSEGTEKFNLGHPDHPAVPVYSVAGVSGPWGDDNLCSGGLLWEDLSGSDGLDPVLLGPGALIAGLEGRANDGMVPTDSMIWGTFLGCVAADHLDQVGQIAGQGGSSFDYLAFYDELVAFLRAEAEPAGLAP